ncbi:hypothetical protein JR590_002113 [Listeria monocytogenes]|uniref:hypothetical protein n=1 Tax=Listeria monocytogenes TaxID=1639 RepID=UPI0010E5748B|nr:hypothetical protein [Listeria monocytogenes]EAD0724654.1 hypothetical protein [Listeria monocytogenes]EAE1298199.1 hypothetical protein [Listeria monocytogenes]EAH4338179.1 hypothetical protein [Listeria monocytogenes]ECJ9723395.1 hypothetical protein [Listeria monocytogenes]ECL1960470.1 hypothetical protein [Listeria monocytogenes]
MKRNKLKIIFRIIELVLGILIIIATSVFYFMDIISGGASGVISAIGMGIFIHANNLSEKDNTTE